MVKIKFFVLSPLFNENILLRGCNLRVSPAVYGIKPLIKFLIIKWFQIGLEFLSKNLFLHLTKKILIVTGIFKNYFH